MAVKRSDFLCTAWLDNTSSLGKCDHKNQQSFPFSKLHIELLNVRVLNTSQTLLNPCSALLLKKWTEQPCFYISRVHMRAYIHAYIYGHQYTWRTCTHIVPYPFLQWARCWPLVVLVVWPLVWPAERSVKTCWVVSLSCLRWGLHNMHKETQRTHALTHTDLCTSMHIHSHAYTIHRHIKSINKDVNAKALLPLGIYVQSSWTRTNCDSLCIAFQASCRTDTWCSLPVSSTHHYTWWHMTDNHCSVNSRSLCLFVLTCPPSLLRIQHTCRTRLK